MRNSVLLMLAGMAAVSSVAFGQAPDNRPPAAPAAPRPIARAPGIDLAVQAAQTIAAACKQYPLGVAVVNAEGAPILIYIPDGANAGHGNTAVRKAYTAVTFKVNSSTLVGKAEKDPDFAAKVKADPKLLTMYGGGLILKAGDDIIGAIGVSGAEPGGHDEECGLIGLEKIKNQLK